MMRAYSKFVIIAAFIFSLGIGTGKCFQVGASPAARDDAPRFRVARSISGSKGSQKNGQFIMEDPRSIFYIPQDRQVIVYLELEGPLGIHRIEGFWKNPSGKVATISDFKYESSEKRFSAYWTLALLESAETGTWTLEAHVDGEYVGAFTFQIVSNAPPAQEAPKKKLLNPAEMYQRALASTVIIESIGKYGELLGVGSGFVIAPDLLLSAFRTVDGAAKTRVRFPDGRPQETDQMLAWNRDQDWVAIKIDAGNTPSLPFAEANSWDIGDLVSYLDVSSAGNRVLSELKIVGKNTFPSAGERLNLSHPATDKAIGAPLLNQYGEAIGMIGHLYSRSYSENLIDMTPAGLLRSQNTSNGAIAVPISLVNLKQTNPTDMKYFNRNKVSFPPLVSARHLSYIQLTHRIEKSLGKAWAVDSCNQFSRRDSKMAIFVMWNPKEAIKGFANFQIFDQDNTAIAPPGKTKEAKIDFKPGKMTPTFWELKMSAMPVGIYHVDVLLNNEPAGRAFFQIVN